MTQSERATAVLNYLEGLDTKTVLNILSPMLSDEALELVYFDLVRDGVMEGDDEEEDEDDPKKAALDYVRSQLSDWKLAEYRALINSAYEYHTTPTAYADFDHIRDLLEEYGQDNDLPEGWWENEGDLDDWLLEL